MKNYSQVFVYASLAFLVYYLARHGFFDMPTIESMVSLLLSLPLLLGGFLVAAEAWRKLLTRADVESRFTECLASMGLSVFGKYIPGKLWTLLGRATYIAETKKRRLATVSAISVNDQLIGLWTGLVLGAAGLFLVGGLWRYGSFVLVAWLGLSTVMFSSWAHEAVERLGEIMLRRSLSLPALDLRSIVSVLPWAFCYWLVWSVAFYLLVRGLSPSTIDWPIGLAFPLAGTLGTMAVVAPGGLGVREGVMTAYLMFAGLSSTDAVTISVASRLWFLFGEMLFFLAGVLAKILLSRHE